MNNLLEDILNNVSAVYKSDSKLDLTKKEDLQKFHDIMKSLRKNENLLMIAHMCGYDNLDEEFDNIDKMADDIYESAHKNDTHIERPSDKLTTDQGLQIHNIVGEYVDTMIRPYNDGQLSNEQINNAYAGLYEFCAWLLYKK